MATPDDFVPVAVTSRSGVDESVHFGAVVCLGPTGAIDLGIALPHNVDLVGGLEMSRRGVDSEYRHFVADRPSLERQLDCLVELHGRERIAEWKGLAAAGDWTGLVRRLLDEHYDPAYRRSTDRNGQTVADVECRDQDVARQAQQLGRDSVRRNQPTLGVPQQDSVADAGQHRRRLPPAACRLGLGLHQGGHVGDHADMPAIGQGRGRHVERGPVRTAPMAALRFLR